MNKATVSIEFTRISRITVMLASACLQRLAEQSAHAELEKQGTKAAHLSVSRFEWHEEPDGEPCAQVVFEEPAPAMPEGR